MPSEPFIPDAKIKRSSGCLSCVGQRCDDRGEIQGPCISPRNTALSADDCRVVCARAAPSGGTQGQTGLACNIGRICSTSCLVGTSILLLWAFRGLSGGFGLFLKMFRESGM